MSGKESRQSSLGSKFNIILQHKSNTTISKQLDTLLSFVLTLNIHTYHPDTNNSCNKNYSYVSKLLIYHYTVMSGVVIETHTVSDT